jgi:HD-like signal output (HDOD) protein
MFGWLFGRWRRRRKRAPHVATLPAPPTPPRAYAITFDDLLPLMPAESCILDPIEVTLLGNELLAEVTNKKLSLPPFPQAAAQVFELVEQPDVDLNKLVRVLHWEPAIATEILRVVNSAQFGRKTDDLRGAVLALGMADVSSIAAGVSAASLFEIESRLEFDLFPERWIAAHRETLVVAFTASWLAQRRGVARHDRVFLRAIIEGAPRILALRALAAQVLAGREAPPPEVIDAALDELQPAVTAVALERWSLPASIGGAIDSHGENEREIVAAVRTLVELRRSPWHDQAAARFGIHARASGLDTVWLRVLVRELDDAAGRVTTMLQSYAAAA